MLDQKAPREQIGRDTFGRYKAQVRSAALATLSILEGKEIDRVYCDLHDDFVIRKQDSNGYSYLFCQVKTKGKPNHRWTLSEVFGLNSKASDQNKQNTKDIKDSFVGKLLLHTVVFDKSCNCVIFQTNIHNDDNIIQLLDDINSGKFANKFNKVLIERFNSCYEKELNRKLSEDEIKGNLSKLVFETDVQHLKQNNTNLEPLAREKIYEFSEVDLGIAELKEILLKLLDLVERKSSGIIQNLTQESIEKFSGISIDDLLPILSISKDAYRILIDGGDKKAIKSASIIQRSLTKSGAGSQEVEYCSRCKTMWDFWLRNNRHILTEFDLNAITQQVKLILEESKNNSQSIKISSLKKPIQNLIEEFKKEGLLYDLNEDLILGGIFSELVKGVS